MIPRAYDYNICIRFGWDRDHDLHVVGKVWPGSPAVTHGDPDNWMPKDPGEIEIYGVSVMRPRKIGIIRERLVSDHCLEILRKDDGFMGEIHDALEENEDDRGED